ncbi:hypothetical protein Daudx_0432 [Candidatus Desulforudis audaxviator]|nr:hypothetical protein Daudx_0432 [Candidatus Desulforudis audaxviator]
MTFCTEPYLPLAVCHMKSILQRVPVVKNRWGKNLSSISCRTR